MRVHALAKEYGIKSTEFVDIIQGFGIGVKSHLSVIDDAQVADIRYKMKNREEILKEHSVEKTELELTESDLDEESFDEYDDGEEGVDVDSDADDTPTITYGELAYSTKTTATDGSGEETVITEDEWELTESEEVDKLLVPDVEEEKTDDWEMTETSGDTSAEQVSIAEVAKEIDKNIEIAGRAREEYAKNVRARQEELKATSHENREQLEPVQEVIVEKPKGFWGWLKSLFT